MKRSDLTMTGQSFNLSPDEWGEKSIILDNAAYLAEIRECFDDSEIEEPENLQAVEIATDREGNFFAVLVPETTRQGVINDDLFASCGNPNEEGAGCWLAFRWEHFEDED